MLILTTLAMGGCVVPPNLEKVVDGGENHAPRINTTLTVPKPGSLNHFQKQSIEFNIALEEDDKQALTMRVFIDRKYNVKIPISPDVTPGGVLKPNGRFELTGLCDELVDSSLDPHFLEFYASDSGFVASGDDLRQVNVGGLSTNTSWDLKCNPPVSGPDGGAL